jgi:hypothetical protein
VVQQVAHHADDSFGPIAELGEAAWSAYVATAWRDLIPPEVYWRDVAKLVAFDDYAHLHRNVAVALTTHLWMLHDRTLLFRGR